MISKLFNALGVSSINSQTFAGGYYYEYSLEIIDGAWAVTRKLHNRYEALSVAESEVVMTAEQIEACKEALMYNFPHAFNADGSVAIDLPELPEPTMPDKADDGQKRRGEEPLSAGNDVLTEVELITPEAAESASQTL